MADFLVEYTKVLTIAGFL